MCDLGKYQVLRVPRDRTTPKRRLSIEHFEHRIARSAAVDLAILNAHRGITTYPLSTVSLSEPRYQPSLGAIVETGIPDVAALLYGLSCKIVAGASIEEALDHIYENFQSLVPYDRIGYADVDIEEGTATARWARSREPLLLRLGYSAPLAGSSLSIVIEHRQPRVLNDLPGYCQRRPESRSTRLIVREGIKSSMTCPLYVDERPIGLLFFSSRELDAYSDPHVNVLKEITMHLAMLLMAADHTSPMPTSRQPEATADPQLEEAAPINLRFSQLEPGMVLMKPVRVQNMLLLSEGTELSQTVIDRLVMLHQKGLVDRGIATVNATAGSAA